MPIWPFKGRGDASTLVYSLAEGTWTKLETGESGRLPYALVPHTAADPQLPVEKYDIGPRPTRLNRGDTFIVCVMPAGNYRWAGTKPTGVLRKLWLPVIPQDREPPGPPMPGSQREVMFTYKAMRRGSEELTFWSAPETKREDAIQEYTIYIDVT